MKLTRAQQEAFDFFKKNNYLVVEAPRRSGKTVLLQAIVEAFPKRRIGVKTLSYPYFKRSYDMYSHCVYIERGRGADEPVDMLIGDEILIEPQVNTPTACAISKRYITTRWQLSDNPHIPGGTLEEMRRELSEDTFQREFGQYEVKR
jgi:hypothetical protein